MMPAWEELAADPALDGVGSVATVDATVETALSSRLDVNGYPTLFAFHDGVVYEHGGDRTAEAMLSFLRAPHAVGQRKGVLGTDGSVHPALIDVLLRVPRDLSQIMGFALETSGVAAALIATFFVLCGALLALAGTPRGAQFIVVNVPPGVTAGQPFWIEYSDFSAMIPGRRKRRVMKVVAPQGIAPGGSFFVPLVAAPKITACDPAVRPPDKVDKAD